jgi:hypothetical protein
MLDTFRESSVVTIIVEEHKYKLPKERLCDSSTFFNSAFNGGFKESQDLELKLEETTSKTFDLIIQWIYTGKLILPTSSSGAAETFTQLLAFVRLADRLDLVGPFDSVISSMKSLLVKHRELLMPMHVRDAVELPREHAVRSLFADACVKEYTKALRSSKEVFKFHMELKEIDSFASDLLRSFGRSIARIQTYSFATGFWDPLTETFY